MMRMPLARNSSALVPGVGKATAVERKLNNQFGMSFTGRPDESRKVQDYLGRSPGLCLFVLPGNAVLVGQRSSTWSSLHSLNSSVHPGPRREDPTAASSSSLKKALSYWSAENRGRCRL